MKAVIMAGGEGSRLRPITLGLPKSMVPLFDRPVLEHSIGLLKRHGFSDIYVTLHAMSQQIISYFGDGAELGVQLTYVVENEPLGTAGSIKNCMTALGEEDFLVISGDAVCDLDLAAALGFHRAKRSDATLVLYRHPNPTEYGLVLTDDDGKIERFVEKPGWGQVCATTVNTGIYILTKKAMDRVPDGKAWDFGRDLFPRLLEEGAPLYGHLAQGYWQDVGDCGAYLDCAVRVLAGETGVVPSVPEVSPGVFSASPLPESVTVVPPCFFGAGVKIGSGSLLGPHVMLGRGVSIGRHSLVQRSVLMEYAGVGDRATLYGAILCRGAVARRGAVLNEGTVLGAESAAGENAILMERVRVWPGQETAPGARLTASLTAGGGGGNLTFGDGGVIRGTFHEDLSPALLMTIGGVLGAEGKVGLGWTGGEAARLLARSAGCGISAAGGEALVHDGVSAATGAWLAARYALPVSLFVEQVGERVFLHFFGAHGLALGRSRERKLEGELLRGEVRRATPGQVEDWARVTGVSGAYTLDVVKRCKLGQHPITPLAVSVPGEGAADRLMAQALEELGCVVLRKKTMGVPGFAAQYGGLRLTAWDEEGRIVGPDTLLTLVSLIEMEQGGGRVAVPSWAPAAIDRLGDGVLRLGRDGAEAEALYENLPWLRDATFGAVRICARLGQTGERLKMLAGRGPKFVRVRREVPLSHSRGEVMQGLVPPGGSLTEGVRVQAGDAWVSLTPLMRRGALKIVAEAADMETAAELCDFYEGKARAADEGQPPAK